MEHFILKKLLSYSIQFTSRLVRISLLRLNLNRLFLRINLTISLSSCFVDIAYFLTSTGSSLNRTEPSGYYLTLCSSSISPIILMYFRMFPTSGYVASDVRYSPSCDFLRCTFFHRIYRQYQQLSQMVVQPTGTCKYSHHDFKFFGRVQILAVTHLSSLFHGHELLADFIVNSRQCSRVVAPFLVVIPLLHCLSSQNTLELGVSTSYYTSQANFICRDILIKVQCSLGWI